MITHFIAVKEDITERKRIEEERNRHITELEDLMSYSTVMNDEVVDESLFKHMAAALQGHFNPDTVAVIMLDREEYALRTSYSAIYAGERTHKQGSYSRPFIMPRNKYWSAGHRNGCQ